MAYYRVEDLKEDVPPLPPPEDAPHDMRKEDQPAFKKAAEAKHKVLEAERKVRVAKMEAIAKEASEYTWAVIHIATGKISCMCEGKAQAEYIAMLLGDRPHA
jgi:hypothetical protein